MEKAKIRPLATPKPLNRSSQKLASVITSWTEPGRLNFVTIGSWVSVPQIRDFAMLLWWLVFLFVFWFFSKATAYTHGRIFTHNTSKMTSFWVRKCLLGVLMTIFYIWTLEFPKTAISGTDFDWTVFLRPKTALTWGCSNIKVPLIEIVAP